MVQILLKFWDRGTFETEERTTKKWIMNIQGKEITGKVLFTSLQAKGKELAIFQA